MPQNSLASCPFLKFLAICLAFWFGALCNAEEGRAQENSEKPTIRDVTPPGMIKVFRSKEATPAPIPDNTPRFPEIHVLPTGVLRSGTATIQLYGVTFPERRKLCTSAAGDRWACGTLAFVALRNLVESQTLACESVGTSGSATIAVCRIGQTNVSAWLLQMGWAELLAGVTDKQYVDAAASGKSSGAGIWGGGPSITQASGQTVRQPTFASPTVVEGRHIKK
jgi:endonuclease YncB( thermonuclease family)